MKISFLYSTFITLSTSAPIWAGEVPTVPVDFHSDKNPIVMDDRWDSHRVDSHAPIGVMGDHTHEAGEIMASYRYMFMEMEGMRVGTDELSAADVFAFPNPDGPPPFFITPTRMTMEMHMLGLMYAPSDVVTLMLMGNYTSLEMDHFTAPGSPPRVAFGETFTRSHEAWGDTKLTALIKMLDRNHRRLHLHLGVSAPTGAINGFDVTPLPYPMQTGSGTWDLITGATYLAQVGNWSYGAQGIGTFRLGENYRDYSLGDRFDGTVWLAAMLSDQVSVSGRLAYATWGNIDGADSAIQGAPVPTAVTSFQGASKLDASFGVNFYSKKGPLKGHRIALEVGTPIYEYREGPMLETDWWIMLGWQKAW